MAIAMTSVMRASMLAATVLATGSVARADETKPSETVGAAPSAVLACFDISAIDELTIGSDYTVYMRNDCPEWVRQAALRRLWKLMPPADVPENSAI